MSNSIEFNELIIILLDGEVSEQSNIPDQLLQNGKWTHFAISITPSIFLILYFFYF